MIEFLRFEIVPWRHDTGRGELLEFRVSASVNGKEHFYRKVIGSDMLTSVWDQLWEEAKYKIDELIKKEQS